MNAILQAIASLVDPQRWASSRLQPCIDLARTFTLTEIPDDDLNDLEGFCQGFAAAIRQETRRRGGWRQRGWDAKGPGTRRSECGSWELPGNMIFDHVYRLVQKERQETVYVSEPYDLTEEGCRALTALAEQGWSITVSAGEATHFPGHTVALVFQRKERGAT